MDWVHRTIIVPNAHVDIARAACEHLAGAGGSGMYTTPLSPNGALPATHYISSGLIEDTFAALLADPELLSAVAGQSGLDPAPLLAAVAVADITDEPADVALARLRLQLCQSDISDI